MPKNPLKKYVRYKGYGDDNFLHDLAFREKNDYILHEAAIHGRKFPEKPLYKIADQVRKNRLLIGKCSGPAGYLFHIAFEIDKRSKIVKQEIYLIGELLSLARHIIKDKKNKIPFTFRDWVNNNCDFSYSTALNFCHVYLVCAGNIQDIRYINLSVLYKVCSKSFPKDLRDFLLKSGQLCYMKLNTLRNLVNTYLSIQDRQDSLQEYENDIQKVLDVQLAREEYLIYIHKLGETVTLLKSVIDSGSNIPKNWQNPDPYIAHPLSNKIINRINEHLTECIDIVKAQKKYLVAYHNNLPSQEPSFSKYYQYNPIEES